LNKLISIAKYQDLFNILNNQIHNITYNSQNIFNNKMEIEHSSNYVIELEKDIDSAFNNQDFSFILEKALN
jgi:hypothetical protein